MVYGLVARRKDPSRRARGALLRVSYMKKLGLTLRRRASRRLEGSETSQRETSR